MVLLSFWYNLVCALRSCEVSYPVPETAVLAENQTFGNISSSFNLFNRNKRFSAGDYNFTDTHSKVDSYPIVLTQNGAIQGYSMTSMQGRRIFAFEGIPFAEPPLGDLRFKAPRPKPDWHGVFKAHGPIPKCIQMHPINQLRVIGSEDCLVLSIYVPMVHNGINTTESLPVIVYFHGGSFFYGSSAEFGPSYLLDQNVILITVNYRLGALGFLSTGDLASPGNWGLKDQALALKWIHKNIVEFAGDPKRVTLMGQSAGGVSVHLHTVSTMTREYFQSGISISGSAFCHWGVLSQERAKTWTSKLATEVKCLTNSSEELVHCLRNLPAAELVGAQLKLFEWAPLHPLIVFAPVVEPKNDGAFLTQSPRQAYANGQVAKYPWIFSMTSQEGHFELYVLQTLLQLLPVRRNLEAYLPYILDYNYLKNGSVKISEMAEKVMRFYKTSGQYASLNAISQMYGDRYFYTPIRKAIEEHSKVAPVFASVFDFIGEYNIGTIFGVTKNDWGVSHGEDIFYYLNSSSFYHGFTQHDKSYVVSSVMNNLVANFAKRMEPIYDMAETNSMLVQRNENSSTNPWTKINPMKPGLELLHLSQDIKMISDPFQERVAFWENLSLES